MEIYRIESDYQFKNISSKNESIINQFREYKGQPLTPTWSLLRFQLLEEVTPLKSEQKREKARMDGFDARCYGNMFFVKKRFDILFEQLNIELLPIEIENNEAQFSFLNVLNIVEAIDFSGLDNQQSMEMLKSNEIKFIRNNLGNVSIFRDKKLINFYYCTKDFKKLIEVNNIQGLIFEKVGKAM